MVAVVAGGWLLARRADAVPGSLDARSGAAAMGGPPVSVTTVLVQKREVDVMLEATGTVRAGDWADVDQPRRPADRW